MEGTSMRQTEMDKIVAAGAMEIAGGLAAAGVPVAEVADTAVKIAMEIGVKVDFMVNSGYEDPPGGPDGPPIVAPLPPPVAPPAPEVDAPYDTKITRTLTDVPHWQIVAADHLPPEVNMGNHHLYVECIDEYGVKQRSPDLHIGWTWEGKTDAEVAPPVPLTKSLDEPAGNIPIYGGQHVTAWLEGYGLPSDRFENVHTAYPEEKTTSGEVGNSLGHHSFRVIFQRKPGLNPNAKG